MRRQTLYCTTCKHSTPHRPQKVQFNIYATIYTCLDCGTKRKLMSERRWKPMVVPNETQRERFFIELDQETSKVLKSKRLELGLTKIEFMHLMITDYVQKHPIQSDPIVANEMPGNQTVLRCSTCGKAYRYHHEVINHRKEMNHR